LQPLLTSPCEKRLLLVAMPMGVEIMTVETGDLSNGEVGLQESDLLDRMPDGADRNDTETAKIRLVSLGCYCAPKLTFKKLGRGAETLPFDWCRTTIEGVLHFLKNDWEGFFDYKTTMPVPGFTMTIFRGYYHSFWHDNPTDPAMHERYARRLERFNNIDAQSGQVLFVRSCSASDEAAKGPELLYLLKARHGQNASLLLIVDFQHSAQGAAVVHEHPDLLIFYLSGSAHSDPDGAPYCEPILCALDWCVGREFPGRQFPDMETALKCIDFTDWGLTGMGGLPAFEEERPESLRSAWEVIAASSSRVAAQKVAAEAQAAAAQEQVAAT